MRPSAFFLALAGIQLATSRPQAIDVEGVASAAAPSIITPAYDVSTQTATVAPISAQAAAASAAVATQPASIDPSAAPFSASLVAPSSVAMAPYPALIIASQSASPSAKKRSHSVEERDGTCAVQPPGSGPVAVPDTPAAFVANPALAGLALNSPTPAGYSLVFANLDASLSASNYMGLYTLKSYDTLGCQSLCDQNAGCVAFNMYAERDPSLDPNAINCPSPPSITNFKCTLWGAPVSQSEANNFGQWRDSFQVVIAASNAYNKASAPSAMPGFDGPTELGGSINAPLGYLGYKYFSFSQSQGYTPQTCASACTAQTAYNQRHPRADGSYDTCAFFNSYVLSKNGVAQGLYCALYNQTWSPQYATNYGQYRGSDRYTVSESYGYTLHVDKSVAPPTFNLIASNSGTIVDGLSFQANAQSGYWSGFNVNLLGEPDVPAVCSLDVNGILSCSGHNLVTYPKDIISAPIFQWVFYTAYGGFPGFETPVTCVDNAGDLQCSNSWGANVLQLVPWSSLGFPNTYMLDIDTHLKAGNFPVTLRIQPL